MPAPETKVGMITVKNPAMLIEEENARQAIKNLETHEAVPPLVAHFKTRWQEAVRAKQDIKTEIIKGLRQRKGEYEPDLKAAIKEQGGTDIFMMLTDEKCRAVESIIKDVMLPADDKPWGISPTPVPDLSPADMANVRKNVGIEIMQSIAMTGQIPTPEQMFNRLKEMRDMINKKKNAEAEEKNTKTEKYIEDELAEGGWLKALDQFITDISEYPTAFLAGPVVRMREKLDWVKLPNGTHYPQVVKKLVKEWDRVSPLDIFPAPGARNVDDGYLIRRHRLTRKSLNSLLGVPGYNEEQIRKALEVYGQSGLRLSEDTQDTTVATLQDRPNEFENEKGWIETLELWDSIQGSVLKEWGVPGVKDKAIDYDVNVWMVGRFIIRVKLNPHPTGKKPIFSASLESSNDSIWGRTVQFIIRDKQRAANAAARALVNNMAFASGPMVEQNVERMADGMKINSISPWQLFQTTGDNTGRANAIQFYQADMNAAPLFDIYKKFAQEASEILGIPNYITGGTSDLTGAGNTASGLAMLLNNASRGIKQVIRNIDFGAIKPAIENSWLFIMLFGQEQSIKGDINVITRASDMLIIAEQLQIRTAEFASATANPVDSAIMGTKGRAELLRQQAKRLKLPVDKIIPTESELIAVQGLQQGLGGQAVPAVGQGGPFVPPRETDLAGAPVSGQDNALFQQ